MSAQRKVQVDWAEWARMHPWTWLDELLYVLRARPRSKRRKAG